ncbi:hypothetical protein MKN04_06045 [Paenibacillus polymyxa]|uniref:Ger(x)C family spore germination C-terminal domain-containing protein n=1 Tax=Paenibacillus polymyxa TaxID=1406 RepID=UPI0004D3FF33|nr:Ger(x)C family spore germination C-terminal domain-containing protein [Paenibacillus polymyxa]KEO79225.1 hypothetical protein EL23_06995 [Paenibacillus polymyxa]MCH6187219.1 hypothetical protein [Paenibacillus polymyxa]WRL59000.1 Ger(x)C family spore germination C-terminal domain-containing protein [Paenibacillus polymyxa]
MLALLMFITGCWDQNNLKDARLANASAYDLTPEGVLSQTLETVDDPQSNQENGCDAFGVGRQLIAHHPVVWKSVDWNEEYPNVRFHPQVTVDIVGNGILN